MRQVAIQGREYPYNFGLRSMMIYEQISGKPYGSDATISSTMLVHFSCLLDGDMTFGMSFAEFVAKVSDKATLASLNDALAAEIERWNSVNATAEDTGKPAKKKKR